MREKFQKNIFPKLKPVQIITGFYFLAVTVSTVLLSLPFVRKDGVPWSFSDALFTAVSAVSVTGLTTVNIHETFTAAGLWILIFVLQIGGIGIMALGTLFWLFFRKKIGLQTRRLIMTEQNQTNLSGLVRLLRDVAVIFIIIEIAGAIVLGTYYLKQYTSWQEAYFHGLFSAASATTNAGFDITGTSLITFADDYFVQTVHMILIILGAIGFPVWIELKNFLFRRKENFHFSLFTKVTVLFYFILVLAGALLFLLFEWSDFLADKKMHEAIFYAFFHSVSARSAGFTTMDLSGISGAGMILLSGLMFIGASPSSVGGGIRTTTFAVNLLFLYHFARGNRSIKIFKREIHDEDILKSFVVLIFGVMICFTAVLFICFFEKNLPVAAVVFEVCSAFGTAGMSLGITAEMTLAGKIVLMILMFIGRVGILTFIFIIGGKEEKENFHYPKERIIIG